MRPILNKNNLPLTLVLFVFLLPTSALANDKQASEPQKTDNQSAKENVQPKVDKLKKPSNTNGSTNFGFKHNPNRYVFHFLAWIDDPYIAYQVIPDPYTGRFHTVAVVRYNRILVRVYLDRATNTYGYFDRFGNPVPYLPNRYRSRCFPF